VLVGGLFRVEVAGLDNLPAGGSVLAGVPHRNWSEPVVLFALLPARPPQMGLADEAAVSRSFLRRLIVNGAGGVIPVRSGAGPSAFERIARATIDATSRGVRVTIFPEVGAPSRPPTLRRLSPGIAHLAARSAVPVVPVVFGGTHELYLRRRVVVRVLPKIEPPPDTRRASISAWMAMFQATVETQATATHEAAEIGAPRRKWWRWLTGRYPTAD